MFSLGYTVYSVTAHTDAYGFVETLSLTAGPTSAVVINPTGDLDSMDSPTMPRY